MIQPIIEITNLGKSYQMFFTRKKTDALQGVHLSIQEGEIWALIGPNGAGKTTLLHCLTGFFHPDQGVVKVFGQDPQNSSTREHLGFQSEIFHTYSFRTAEQILKFYGQLQGMNFSDIGCRITEVLKKVDLESVRTDKVSSFSKGMIQRLGLAQSLLHDPSLMIWDEPSTGLDPEGRRLVIDLLEEMKAQGKTVLFSTHILSDIERVCDHVAILHRGRILVAEAMAGLLDRYPGKTLEDIYLEYVRGDSHEE